MEECEFGVNWSTHVWERAERYLKAHKEGTHELGHEEVFQYSEKTDQLIRQINLNKAQIEKIAQKLRHFLERVERAEAEKLNR